METLSRQQSWECSGLINAEQNSPYGGELYSIYIVLRFIADMWDSSSNKSVNIRIRCNNLSVMLDSSQTALNIEKTKNFLRSITSD